MKKITTKISIAAIAMLPLLTSCSSSDDVTAGPAEQDIFLHPYGATAADQALQEAFYKKNKLYVLFNDTLSKKQTSVNPDGTPFYEYKDIDMRYNLHGFALTSEAAVFSYEYLTSDADKAAAVSFLDNEFLPSLGESLRPISFLLVDQISYVYDYYGSKVWGTAQVWPGWRCTAVAMHGIGSMDAAQRNQLRLTLLQAIVASKIGGVEESKFDEFYSYCNDYYSKYAMYDDALPFFEKYPTPMDLGLLDNTVSYYRWNSDASLGLVMYNIAAKSYDLQDYTNTIFKYSEEEFMAKYGEYPIVVKKYQVLKAIIEELGVKL